MEDLDGVGQENGPFFFTRSSTHSTEVAEVDDLETAILVLMLAFPQCQYICLFGRVQLTPRLPLWVIILNSVRTTSKNRRASSFCLHCM